MQATTKNTAEIYIYDQVVTAGWEWGAEQSAVTFQEDLARLGDEVETIHLHINSPGGAVFEGITIANLLKAHDAKVIAYIDGLAASIASVIAVCADEVIMGEGTFFMIHHPWLFTWGDANALRKDADMLDKVSSQMQALYLAKTGEKCSSERLVEMLDEETWLTATEALELGFVDSIVETSQVAASVNDIAFARFKNIPEALKQSGEPKAEPLQPKATPADSSKNLLKAKIKIMKEGT
jgi:ATP-dependent Clp protease protease subunit